MPYLLLTESLQTDFVAPLAAGERLPNTLHIGRAESRRLGLDDIAACSALPASSSHIHHREALEHLASGLGVTVIDSIPEFHAWLGIRRDGAVVTLRGRLAPDVTTEGDTTLGDEVRRLVEYLFRDCASVRLKPLSGGFSGSQVFMTESVDRRGLQEIPFVVKVDAHAKIAKERAAVESIENALGFVSPRMAEFADLETLGAIKYQFAAVQALFQNVVQRVMRRLYQKTTVDRLQLHQYYEFQPRYGGKTLAIARELGAKFGAGRMTVPGVAGDFQDPAGFYAARPDWLGREAEEVPCGWIHGDLNLANILLDETGNTWMIDYVWTRVGHAVQDIAKLENDLKFIKVPLADDPALQRAIDWERLLLADDDQLAPAPALPARLAADPAIAKAQAAITILRDLRAAMLRDAGLAAPLSARHYWLAQLRYSAHTLTFDESDVRQKRFALASTALLAERLR